MLETYLADIFNVIGQFISDSYFLLAGITFVLAAKGSNISGWNYFDLKYINVFCDLLYAIFQTSHQNLKRVAVLCQAAPRSYESWQK